MIWRQDAGLQLTPDKGLVGHLALMELPLVSPRRNSNSSHCWTLCLIFFVVFVDHFCLHLDSLLAVVQLTRFLRDLSWKPNWSTSTFGYRI